MISLIVALSSNNIIGFKNNLPWYLPADLAWFKKNTINKTVIMGRLTFESIGHPLINRLNIVISSKKMYNSNFSDNNLIFVKSLQDAFNLKTNTKEKIIIGGTSIYKQSLIYVDKIYITRIDKNFIGDKKFPNYLIYKWITIFKQKYKKDLYNSYNYSFEILKRVW